jgi:integrase
MTQFYGRTYKGVKKYADRHGKVRCYYRPTGKDLPNPDAVKFRVFDQAYWEAVAGQTPRVKVTRKTVTLPETSVDKIVAAYLKSAPFAKLAKDTRISRENLLKHWVKDHGDKQLSTLPKAAIEQALKNRSPTTGKNWFYAVRSVIQWAMAEKQYRVMTDVTQGVKLKPVEETGGWTPWTEPNVAAFVKKWPKGTMQYRALMVLLGSGQRGKDVVTFGWSDVEEGEFGLSIRFKQSKTGKKMLLPIAPSLLEVLPPRPENVVDLRPVPFLTTTPERAGWKPRPFTRARFTAWFGEACEAAGLPNLSPHGTRKLAAQRIYRTALRAGRNDATAITMAFTGHKTEKQLRVYLGEDFEQEEYAGELAAFMR